MNGAYSGLAGWFEYLNADCDYEKWSQYLYDALKSLGVSYGKGLDVGCGSGVFCRSFAKRGFSMTGYDVSEEMLVKAEQLAAEEGVRSTYVLSDARRLKNVGEKADFVICVNDCLNYLPQKDVPQFFKRVSACLKRSGAFLFDVSSAYKLREVVGCNTFCEDREEISWMWFNTLYPDRVEMDFTLFEKCSDGRFIRKDERHTQYIHEKSDLIAAARGSGFKVCRIEGALGDSSDRNRENYLCVREQ